MGSILTSQQSGGRPCMGIVHQSLEKYGVVHKVCQLFNRDGGRVW